MLRSSSLTRSCALITALSVASPFALANGFMPTMMSANVLWLFVLAPVVLVEGWLMKRWNWAKPYEHALRGNLVSLAAGLPFGILLSFLGAYLGSEDGQRTFSFLPEQVRFFTIQVLLYGDTPVPSYGFMGYSNAGILLAAILFIGLCWLLTFVVEGYYYAHKNPQRVRSEIVRKTALANMFSYGLLMLFWFPYSYYTARSSEMLTKTLCSEPSSWSTNCFQLLEKYPEVKDSRLQACKRFAITPDSCLKGPNSVNRRISGR